MTRTALVREIMVARSVRFFFSFFFFRAEDGGCTDSVTEEIVSMGRTEKKPS